MEMHVRNNLCCAGSIVLHDVVVGFVVVEVGEYRGHDGAGDEGKDSSEMGGLAGGEVADFGAVGAWKEEDVAAG